MPAFSDISQFLGGQFFGRPYIPTIDLSDKTIVVTGGNTGVGFECAKHLVKLNVSYLILACRSTKKGEAAKARILEETNTKAHIGVWEVDLDRYSSVVAFSKRVLQLPRLDGFLANAGVEHTDFGLSEGVESTLTINVISTFLMAILVLPALKTTAEKYDSPANLSFVSSMVHIFGPETQLEPKPERDTFETLSDPKTADMGSRYPLSKLIEHLCFLELMPLASKAAPKVTVNLVNPGWCATELSRHKGSPLFERVNAVIFQRTAEQGSRTLVHAVTAGSDTHGKYLSECVVKPQSDFVRSERCKEVQVRIWKELVSRIEKIEPGAMKDAGLS